MSESESGVDLSLVTRDEIIEELHRRHEAVLLVTCSELGHGQEDRVCDFRGYATRATGLAHAAVAYMTSYLTGSIALAPRDQDDEEVGS